MVRVNGDDSRATVEHLWTDISGGLGCIYLQLNVPMDEFARWMIGSRVSLEADWQLEHIPVPAHADLAEIIESRSVQGGFFVKKVQPSEGWFLVEVLSSGVVKPLQS